MYDPSKKADRQRMGIEDNLATQQEETGRMQTAREEQFMRRQIDNMANREKIDQELIKVLGNLEDTLSGLMGAKVTAGNLGRAGSTAAQALGGGMMAAAMIPSPASPFLAAAGGAMMLLGSAIGDGDADGSGSGPSGTPAHNRASNDSSRDHEIMVPSGGRGSKKVPLSVLKRSPRMSKLQPSLREKLIRMMRENPRVGINSGYRDESHQERLFYEQMEETTADRSEVEWDGRYWKPKSGKPFTAPPGRSMHGVGLAADIFEEGRDYSWIVANSARFGLNNWRAKGWRHDEPWHVQPQEVPRFRSQYDGGEYKAPQQSRPDGWFEDNPQEDYGGGGYPGPHEAESALSIRTGSMGISGSMSIPLPALIDAHKAAGLARFLSGGTGSYGSATGEGASATTSAASALPKNRQLTGAQVARYAKKYFSGDDLITAIAIAKAESGWRTGAFNPNGLDNSYGLMQMNMYGDMGPARRERWGLSNNSELYNPDTNMRAAHDLYSRTGGFSHWTTYTSGKYLDFMDEARAAANEVGDPSPSYMPSRGRASGSGGQSRSTTNHYTSSPTINVAPVINFNGAPATPDLKRIAQSVSKLIKEEVDMIDLRSA
jgi:hypothetical protein